MNIYVPVEVKVRDLEGRILLALAAAERGHTVVVGGKEDTLGLAQRGMLKPGIVHDKSLTPSSVKLETLRELNAGGARRDQSGRGEWSPRSVVRALCTPQIL